jgi:hypothetical protein
LSGLACIGLLIEKTVASPTVKPETRAQPIMPNAGSITYWYLQVPNLILLSMMVLLLLRLVLSLVPGTIWGITRPVGAITHPVVVTVGAMTPRMVPAAGVIVCAIAWLMLVRTVLIMTALALGVRL